jgi:hypothetical protein
MTTSATVSEPRAAGDSAAEPKPSSAAPVTTATVAGEPAPEQKGVVKDRASRVLASLSPDDLRKWKLTGELPENAEIEEEREFTGNENEALLAQMTKEERKVWRETGVIADRILNPPAEKPAAKADEGDKELAELVETSPLAKIHSLTVREKDGQLSIKKGSEAEADEMHTKAAATLELRMDADRKGFSPADQAATFKAWEKLAPLIPENLLTYIRTGIQPHLNAPYKFFREFVLNEQFRKEVLQAGFGDKGSLDKMVKRIAKFDSKFSPEKPASRVSRAPAPAANISGRATAPLDEVAAAVNAGDFRRFRAAENRADYLRRTGRSG